MSKPHTRARPSAAARATTALVLLGCAAKSLVSPTPLPNRAAARPVERPSAPVDSLATPPPAGELPAVRFPKIGHVTLGNGMEVRLVALKGEPLVDLRFVVLSGTASDGDRPGLSALTGELLKEGGAAAFSAEELVGRADSLGARLELTTAQDSTSISITVATPDFERALGLIADVALWPRFSPIEFVKLRAREIERVKDAERGDADWAAVTLLYRRLFADPPGQPYAHEAATADELRTLTLDECRKWCRRYVVPQNTLLVVAGDVDEPEMGLRAKEVFDSWRGVQPPTLAFPTPAWGLERRIWVIDRPHAEQSEVYVATLGSERLSPSWPALAASNQILDGGVASRLFVDVREKRSLAYHAGSSLDELAHGPVPLILSAGTQAAKTSAALRALLDNLNGMAQAPPSAREVAMAKRSLTDSLLFRTERIGELAELTTKLAVFQLPDDYFQDFQRRLDRLDTTTIFTTARSYYDVENPVIVVAGDAAVVAESLRSFGNVEIVDPERDFTLVRELAHE